MKAIQCLLCTSAILGISNAQFFNFFNGGQQREAAPKKSWEEEFLNNNCEGYLCQDTQTCVKSSLDCPCPFPQSQLKCVLPNKKSFVCISKPATHDEELQKLYDDELKGPKAKVKGYRDCGWVQDAWKGLV